MLVESAWRLGVGVALGWAALPLLVKLARRSRHAPPGVYYRALVATLAIATALLFAPALRGWTGLELELSLAMPGPAGSGARSIVFVPEWVDPLLGSRERPWSSLSLSSVLTTVGIVWLFLASAGIAHSVWGRIGVWRAYRQAAAAPPAVIDRAARIAAELDIRLPELRVAPGLPSAFTFGLLSPVVVLGAAACHGRADELDFILRHELLHVARSDARAAFWIELAQRCFTGHPCLRALAGEIRFAREATVDEAAAGAAPFEYARFLLVLAERVRFARFPAHHLISMADTTLERRVEMLIASTRKPVRSWRNVSWLGLCGLALGALVFLAPSSWGQGDAGPNGPDHTRVWGNLLVEQVEGTVFGEQGQGFKDCYAMLAAPRPTVYFRMQFDIAESGRFKSGRLVVSEHPELAPCLEDVMKAFVFPAPSSGTVAVDFPVKLTPPLAERNARAEAEHGVSHRLPKEVIQKVVKDHYPRFAACYEALPKPLPSLTMKLDFTIGLDGSVSDGEVAPKEPPEFARCLDGVMRSMVFPPPKDGIVTVGYPLMFAP
jgi:beta-lactamase regulating signal transducer with metallopeptidase domain